MLTGPELGAAIASALDQNGKTQADAARHFGVKSPSVNGWIKTGRISKENFEGLRSWLSLTPDSHWGAARPPLAQTAALPPDTVAVRSGAYRRVPLLGKAMGGMPERIWDSDGTFEATWDEYAEVATLDPRAFLSRVVGMSMYPRFRPGELALIEPDTDPAVEDDVLVRLRSGETLLKRLLWRGDSVRLGSYNESSVLEFPAIDVLWLYYAAHPLSARKLKQRV